MYEENENKINWGNIIKKIIIVIAVILVLLGIISLVSRCTKKTKEEKPTEVKVDLTDQLNELEAATLKYLTKDILPVELNSSKTIRLKVLVNKEILTGITDRENNKCDINDSYAEVTRLENNYAVKLSVTCGPNKDYRIIYVGCFDDCNGGVCKGTENSTGGVCNDVANKKDDKDKTSTTKPSTNTGTQTNKKPNNTSNKKPNTNVNTNTNSKPTTNTNTNSNTVVKQTLYEYKRCRTTCTNGILNTKTNKCEFEGSSNPTVSHVSYNNSSLASKKNSSIGYEFKNFSNGKYNYIKYECPSDYDYNYKTKNCTPKPVDPITKCETIWDTATSKAGWTPTGNTK